MPGLRRFGSRGAAWIATGCALVALVLLSPAFGRARMQGDYRPELPADALTSGCWPLPGDVRLPFEYQVRTDVVATTISGQRRLLTLQYDRIDGDRALRAATEAFREAGVLDQVAVTVLPIPDLGAGDLVRGALLLDLPPTVPDGDQPGCDESSTKQFPGTAVVQ